MAEKKHHGMQEKDNVELIRILGKDLRGDKKVGVGLTKINGISWAFSNALCKIIELDTEKTIQDLTAEDIAQIEKFMKEAAIPTFMKNRQKDFETGKDEHLYGPDLKLKHEFDIKRLRKIKSYRGIRHANKLPVRGQRTKSNFRPNKKKSGKVGGSK